MRKNTARDYSVNNPFSNRDVKNFPLLLLNVPQEPSNMFSTISQRKQQTEVELLLQMHHLTSQLLGMLYSSSVDRKQLRSYTWVDKRENFEGNGTQQLTKFLRVPWNFVGLTDSEWIGKANSQHLCEMWFPLCQPTHTKHRTGCRINL